MPHIMVWPLCVARTWHARMRSMFFSGWMYISFVVRKCACSCATPPCTCMYLHMLAQPCKGCRGRLSPRAPRVYNLLLHVPLLVRVRVRVRAGGASQPDEDAELQRAIELSMQDQASAHASQGPVAVVVCIMQTA